MKKNFIKAANALMFGAFAMSSLSLASCADDNELNNTAKQEVAKAASTKELEGAFTGTIYDNGLQKDINAFVSGNSLSLNVGTEKTGFTSVTAKLTSSADGKTLNGAFDESFMGIKTFKFSKVGSYYFNMECVAADGTTKEIGFFKTLATRAAMQDGEVELSYLKGVASKGFEALVELVPGGKIVIGPMVDLLFPDEKEPDMPVSECYAQLDKSIKQVSNQVIAFQQEFEAVVNLTLLQEHNELRAGFEVPTRRCVNEIISLKQSDDPAAQDSINTIVKTWGAEYAKDARRFIFQTKSNVVINNEPYSSIADAMAEKMFAWEHQGYKFREAFRLKEIASVAECAAMLAAYGEVVSWEKDPDLADDLKIIAEKFKSHEVVIDNENAICQISGAHHLKLKKDRFGQVLALVPGRIGEGCKSIFNFPGLEATKDLGFLVVPVLNKDKDYATNPEFIKERDAMITVDEAKAIMNYYGNKKSMCDILREEAGIDIRRFSSINPRILLLYGTKTYSANEKDGRMESGGNVQYRSKDIYFETVCYFDKTENALAPFLVGNMEIKWQDWGGLRVPPFYYNKWNSCHDSGFDFMKPTVTERNNDWNPGNYIKKQ